MSTTAEIESLASQEYKYGFFTEIETDSAPPTLQQLGKLIGVTKERVRQIESRALAKLRRSLKAQLN